MNATVSNLIFTPSFILAANYRRDVDPPGDQPGRGGPVFHPARVDAASADGDPGDLPEGALPHTRPLVRFGFRRCLGCLRRWP